MEQNVACIWAGVHSGSAVLAEWAQGPSQLAGAVTSVVASMGGMHGLQGLPALRLVQAGQLKRSTAACQKGKDLQASLWVRTALSPGQACLPSGLCLPKALP